MKKLITSAVAALALLFGFVSCSGDLHDDVFVDPNAMEGNWFYTAIDISALPETSKTINIIFNDGTNQTKTIEDVNPTAGSVAYLWASKTKEDIAAESKRTDCPDKSSLGGEGKLVVYCFSNASKVNIWAWAGNANFTGGTWPGLSMTTDAEIKIENVKVSLTFKVTGAKSGDRLYINGAPWSWSGDWPFDEWNKKDEDKDATAATKRTDACLELTDRFTTADASGVATFKPLKLEIDKSDSEKTYEIKVVSIEGKDPRSYKPGISYDKNGSFAITPNKDASYTVTIDVSGGSYNCSVE